MTITQDDIARLISEHLDELRKPGVLSARPGFVLRDHWLTEEPAIVATVAAKLGDSPDRHGLPRTIGGVFVDVRPASPRKLQRLMRPEDYAGRQLAAPDAGKVPEFPNEINLVAADPPGAIAPLLVPDATKPNLPYTPPTGVPLSTITGATTIHLSASPDSAWPTLGPFLASTESSLTVGMYDITSAHVADALATDLTGKTFKLTLDHPARNPTADQTDEQTVAQLKSALGSGFTQAWALERMDPLAAAWIFPTAYHIKVAVRDSASVWVSSGNWNNSNQPDIDPVSNPGDATAARSGDRDWHVIVDRADLATTFEKYLLNDLSIAGQHDTTSAVSAEIEPHIIEPRVTTPPFAQFFAAQTITDEMTITPLLTPEPGVYVDAVTTLISSAKTSLHMQFQYIEQPTTTDASVQPFASLIQAVIERQKAGVEVQIIMSEFETAGYLEQLQAAGLDVVNNVKLQNNVHNKGIIVDAASVLVSSQNWSADGVLFNRDAGVIVANAQVAAYFEKLFAHDWIHLAAQKALND